MPILPVFRGQRLAGVPNEPDPIDGHPFPAILDGRPVQSRPASGFGFEGCPQHRCVIVAKNQGAPLRPCVCHQGFQRLRQEPVERQFPGNGVGGLGHGGEVQQGGILLAGRIDGGVVGRVEMGRRGLQQMGICGF